MTAANQAVETINMPGDISGRIIDCGRGPAGNQVVIDCGRGHQITINGLSDASTRTFAANLYNYVVVKFGVQRDG